MHAPEKLCQLLASIHAIAILGAADNPAKPVDRVGRYLIEQGFAVYPVHPVRKAVWGREAYPSLGAVPVSCELVVLFRAPQYCPGHAKEVQELSWKPLGFWMQEGIASAEARALLEPLGISVVEDRCVMVEHARCLKDGVFEQKGLIQAPVDDSPVFTCQMCGQCCRGEGGIVVSPTDLGRITRALGVSAEEFRERYGEERGGKLQIRTGDDGACIFFREGKGCAVHAGKPDVCRAWPFFRGNIVDAESFALAKDYCPGINPEATHAEFAREGRNYLRKHGLLAHDVDTEGRALILDAPEGK